MSKLLEWIKPKTLPRSGSRLKSMELSRELRREPHHVLPGETPQAYERRMAAKKNMKMNKEEVEQVAEADKAIHPMALHYSDAGGGKYKVHAVGKKLSGGIKVGEHLSDSDLDDAHEMGAKLKMVKHDQMKESVKTTHENPLVTVHDKDGHLHTHANLSVANDIFGTKVKHTDVHKGPVKTKNREGDNLTFAVSMHHAKAVEDEEKFKKQYGEEASATMSAIKSTKANMDYADAIDKSSDQQKKRIAKSNASQGVSVKKEHVEQADEAKSFGYDAINKKYKSITGKSLEQKSKEYDDLSKKFEKDLEDYRKQNQQKTNEQFNIKESLVSSLYAIALENSKLVKENNEMKPEDDEGPEADKNITVQLKKAADMKDGEKGGADVEFADGNKHFVHGHVAHTVLSAMEKMKPAQRLEAQKAVHQSHAHLMAAHKMLSKEK